MTKEFYYKLVKQYQEKVIPPHIIKPTDSVNSSDSVAAVAAVLNKQESFMNSFYQIYPLIFYFIIVLYFLFWGVFAEKTFRYINMNKITRWSTPIFFKFLQNYYYKPLSSLAILKGRILSQYRITLYSVIVFLNNLTLQIYIWHYKILIFLILLLILNQWYMPSYGLNLFLFWSLKEDINFFSMISFVFFNSFNCFHWSNWHFQEKFLFYNHFLVNDLLIFILIIFLLITVYLFIIMKRFILLDFICNFEYNILFGFNIFSLSLILFCSNFFTLLILLEIFSYTTYILVVLRKQISFKLIAQNAKSLFQNNPFATEAGIKYFIYGALNSIFYIFSLIFLLIPNYDLFFNRLSFFFHLVSFNDGEVPFYLIYIVCFLLMYFFFKFGAFPLHFWLPDIFLSSSYLVISYISLPVKLIFLTVFISIFYGVFLDFGHWSILSIIASLCGMLWGAVGMIKQTQIKRFFAYSTINHMSYILFGLSVPAYLRTFATKTIPEKLEPGLYENFFAESIFASIIYFIGYLVMMLMVFTFLVILQTPEKSIGYLTQLVFLDSIYGKLFRIIFFLLLMSLIGVPPLLGFWGKYYIFYIAIKLAGLHGGFLTGFALVIIKMAPIIIILSSIISAYAYLMLVKIIYVDNNNPKKQKH